VATVLELARVLELKAVAEGVEGSDQLAHLQALHCDFGQGFLFAKPLNGVGLREVLRLRREVPVPALDTPAVAVAGNATAAPG